MKVISKTSMKRIEQNLAAAYEVITTGVWAEHDRVPTPVFVALSACFADISAELGINLLNAVDELRRNRNEPD